MDVVRIAVVGLGYWGPNLLRNFSNIDNCRVKTCCDLDWKVLERTKKQYPSVDVTDNYDILVSDPDLDAVAIAVTASKHFELAKKAILNGKHVFVEKPLTTTLQDAEELVGLAQEKGVKLMVGHLMEYHPAVELMKEMVQNGELGEIYYMYSQRVNLGQIRRDENALWSLAPHDISIIIYLLETDPVNVSARGQAYIQKDIEDVVFLNMEFPNKIIANVQLSWLDPHKIRRTTIVGSKKMAVFDDMEPSEMVRVYDKGVVSNAGFGSFGDSFSLRFGEVRIPYIKLVEPLRLECQHFIDCIIYDRQPRSDGNDGLRVVRVLQAAQESLKRGGIPICLEDIR